jgi:hypothetical protein
MPAWIPCPCCECFWCSRHGMHAHDCPCPPIEEWDEDPYEHGDATMTTTYATKWGATTVEIAADFDQASCPVEGADGMQVADFRHSPQKAMRHVLEQMARADGDDPESDATAALIDDAIAEMDTTD